MTRTELIENFIPKIKVVGKCWVFSGGKSHGYGKFWDGKRRVMAHRFSYELFVGEIPKELCIDHLCRNRACVRPSHMEVVTLAENVRRGYGPAANNRGKKYCIRGHLLEGENLQNAYKRAGRVCKQCRHIYRVKEYQKYGR